MLIAALLLCLTPQASGVDYDRDNVVICLDASGSMRHGLRGSGVSKMDAAKSAIRTVLATVPESTQVGLLVFSGRNKENDWVFPLGERDDQALMNALMPVLPAGKTPLGENLKRAGDALLAQRKAQNGYGTFRLLVVTDGEATDEAVVEAFLPDLLRRGLILDVVGVAMDSDHDLATRVHSYRRADDDAGLRTALSEVFAEVQTKSGADLADEFELLDAFPDDSVQGIIDRMATRNDAPINAVKRRAGVTVTHTYGTGGSGSGVSFSRVAGILGLACFVGFAFGITLLTKLIRKAAK